MCFFVLSLNIMEDLVTGELSNCSSQRAKEEMRNGDGEREHLVLIKTHMVQERMHIPHHWF